MSKSDWLVVLFHKRHKIKCTSKSKIRGHLCFATCVCHFAQNTVSPKAAKRSGQHCHCAETSSSLDSVNLFNSRTCCACWTKRPMLMQFVTRHFLFLPGVARVFCLFPSKTCSDLSEPRARDGRNRLPSEARGGCLRAQTLNRRHRCCNRERGLPPKLCWRRWGFVRLHHAATGLELWLWTGWRRCCYDLNGALAL